MGFSTSSTHMIFFIGAAILATVLAGIFTQSISSVSSGIEAKDDILYESLCTDITIINDPENMPNDPLTIYVKNTGKSTLDQNLTTVIVDQDVKTTLDTTTLDGTDYWESGGVIEIEVTGTTLTSGDHSVKIITQNGVSDRLDFRIG